MTASPRLFPRALTGPAAALAILAVSFGLAVPPAAAKDVGPAHAGCDAYDKGSSAWRNCALALPAASGPADADAELFYAGYWLARNGRYREALDMLNRAEVKNARVLTYIGFATRKLGRLDEAFGHYQKALALDPANAIARSYLGEAHLARDDVASAESELQRVEALCGSSCAAYRELAGHIEAYRARRHG